MADGDQRIKISNLPDLSEFSTYGYPYLVGNTNNNSHTGLIDSEYLISCYLSEHGGTVTLSAINAALSDASEHDYGLSEYKFLMYYDENTIQANGVYYLSEYFGVSDHYQLNNYLSSYIEEYLSQHHVGGSFDMSSYMAGLSAITLDYEEYSGYYLIIQKDDTDSSTYKIHADTFIAGYISTHAQEIYSMISQYLH